MHPFMKIEVGEISRDIALGGMPVINAKKALDLGASLPQPNMYVPKDFSKVELEYNKLKPKDED